MAACARHMLVARAALVGARRAAEAAAAAAEADDDEAVFAAKERRRHGKVGGWQGWGREGCGLARHQRVFAPRLTVCIPWFSRCAFFVPLTLL